MGKHTMLQVALLSLLWSVSSAQQAWPDCIQIGVDFTGSDLVSGYRFSNEECALWCQTIGTSKCAQWVYKSQEQQCFIKSAVGTQVVVNGSAAEDTYAGLGNCFFVKPVPWPDCSTSGQQITGSDPNNNTAGYSSPDKETCSTDCQISPNCSFWQYMDNVKLCYFKTAAAPTTPMAFAWIGPKSCYGRVTIDPPNTGIAIDGNWSPWSTLNTPCVSAKTGQQVQCGGGVQRRFRSCTDPRPRFGGLICPGEDEDEYPCNTNDCALPAEYLWSDYGPPDKLCSVGTQTRTTLCGTLRRRLPLLPGVSEDNPPVAWPGCLSPWVNAAIAPISTSVTTLQGCFNGCKANTLCQQWSFNLDKNNCSFYDSLDTDTYLEQANVVTGANTCAGTLYAPYCAQYQQINAAAPVISPAQPTPTYFSCADACANNTQCAFWYLRVSTNGSKTCELRGNSSSTTMTAANETGIVAFFGARSCASASIQMPVTPEDAVELGYREVCQGNQYQEQSIKNNTWNKKFCPSPCISNADCPTYAKCNDLSTDIASNYSCSCQLGTIMMGGLCISPPATTNTPRPIPKLKPNLETFAKAITRTSYFILIICCLVTLALFAFFRVFNRGRFIHMNIEVALVLAHLCMVPNFAGGDHQTTCRNISICIHFFYTAAFAFYVMEAVYVYSCVSYAVRKDGMLSNMGNFMAGWGLAIIVIAFTVSFDYNHYGGTYHCFLQMNSPLIYGEFVPYVVFCVVTIMMIEAANNVDEDNMVPLDDTDPVCLTSAKYMLHTLFVRLVLTFCCFTTGAIAFYRQSIAMYSVFTILTGCLGVIIFLAHCTSNEKVRSMLKGAKDKVCGKKNPEENNDKEPFAIEDGEDENA